MAQQKKTDTSEAERPLKPEELEFVVALSTGSNQTQAYRHAFDVAHWTDAAIRVAACRLAKRPNIMLTLDSLAEESMDKARLSYEEHLKELARLSKRAELAGNYGAAVQAEINRGKAAGIYIERTADVTPMDPLQTLNELAKISPDAARALAHQYGYDLEDESVH